jgi:hypothetical protein
MAVITRVAVLMLTVAGLGLVQSGTALAATAPNDDFASATVISALPFSDVVDNTSATTEPGEPTGQCQTPQHTVWYSITPASDMTIRVDMSGTSFFDAAFDVYQQTGSGFAGLSTALACAGFGSSSSAHFQASANTTYYIQAGSSCCTSGGSLHLNVREILPPAGDNFANAVVISPAQLPFTDSVDAGAATREADEPFCQNSNSWWYSFTPTSTGSYTTPTGFGGTVAVYTGSALSNLSQIGCAGGGSLLTFRATAGTTYYLQDSDFFRGDRGPLEFTLDHSPQPIARFFIGPSDPSIFDTVQFSDNSVDPAQAGIQAEAWDFGDGTTGTGPAPTHRYAADGDYTASLTITTTDGRTASAQQVIHVQTHDVAITKFSVPTSARAGRTRSITVGISDKRYPETVQVQLLKSNAQGGFDVVGTLTQSIPVKTGKKTTPFSFNYTFTPSDAAVGKVTFEAIATIQGSRDAFPADNTVLATTTVH